MNKRIKSNSIRIIAGSWRGRRLRVLDSVGLRPTTDRVRETLFNWLMHDIVGARCLDLFAGTGVLGLECLSRGASFVQLVESDAKVAEALKDNMSILKPAPSTQKIVNDSALNVLKKPASQAFDIVFLDPPFKSTLLAKSLPLLVENGWLAKGAYVYTETDSKIAEIEVPESWCLHRSGSAGQSEYRLYGV